MLTQPRALINAGVERFFRPGYAANLVSSWIPALDGIQASAFAFASGLVAFLVSSQLQRLISGPILSLVQTARAVTEEKNYSVRAVKQNDDELGVLIDAFNEMAEHAEQMGANGIVSMRYDANEVMNGITEVLAYGTAVRLEKT